MDITAPKRPPKHPYRGIDREFAMEPAFQEPIAAAVATGWSEAEAAEAILKLARNNIAGMLAD